MILFWFVEYIELLSRLSRLWANSEGDLPEKKVHLTANLGRESPKLCPNKFWSRIC